MTTTTTRLGASAAYIAGTNTGSPRPDASKYRSLGDVIAAASQEDASADSHLRVLARAYSGAVSSDGPAVAVPPFVKRDLLTQAENRPTWAAFTPGELPEVGKTLEFPKFAVSGDVTEQGNEGDDLTYLELVVTTGLTGVKTYGGYVQISSQADRSPSYLDRAFQLGLVKYAKRTNAAAVAALGALAGGDPNAVTLPFADRLKAGAWIDAALSAAWAIQDNSVGLAASVWLMPRVQFRALANIVDTANRPVFDLDVARGRGTVSGLEVVSDGALPAGVSWVASRDAFTVREEHPVRQLAKVNSVNLTKSLPVYGFAAVEPSDVKGLTRVTHPAA